MRALYPLAIAAVVVLSAAAVGAPAAAQADSSLDVTVTAGAAEAGGNVTVTVDVTNDGDEASAVIVNATTLPARWSVVASDADGGSQQSETKWLFMAVAAGDSVSPSLTLAVPSNATGDHTIGVAASTDQTTASDEATISLGGGSFGAAGPGFGPAVAVVALLGAALLARARR
jgi:PGF-CTERM protein